jgi:uncharacterized LabA/DUF88 family protein
VATLPILVDYDNVLPAVRRRGAWYVAERAVAAVATRLSTPPSRIRVRLYGGWYSPASLTHVAQQLAAELYGIPTKALPYGLKPGAKSPVLVELAYSLEADPSQHLLHTFRQRGEISDIRCHNPRKLGCSVAACPAMPLDHLVKSGQCPEPGCQIDTSSLLYRAQQKLVDTMLASDLLHLAHTQPGATIALVTSDDDFWPPIKTALVQGASVIQVHTKRGATTPTHYASTAGPTYHQSAL